MAKLNLIVVDVGDDEAPRLHLRMRLQIEVSEGDDAEKNHHMERVGMSAALPGSMPEA